MRKSGSIINRIKKLTAVMTVIALGGAMLSACSLVTNSGEKGKGRRVVCTIFPEYDWVMNLLKDNEDRFDVTLLIDNGTDLHSYQASAKNIMTIENCDLFIYVGGESDNWVKDVLKEHPNPNRTDLNLMEVLGDKVYCEEIIEGMQSDEDKPDNVENAENEDAETSEKVGAESEEEPEYDEHVWLSLKNAEILCSKITEELKKLDFARNYTYGYDQALENYLLRLKALDEKFAKTVENAKTDTLVFGDRFPFRYMVEDYGLEYYAAFPGCSAETEASFETVVYLAGVVDNNGISKICVTETSDQSIAKTIIENSKDKNAEVVVFDSMQSVTKKDIEEGKTYLSYMKSNLGALEKALF